MMNVSSVGTVVRMRALVLIAFNWLYWGCCALALLIFAGSFLSWVLPPAFPAAVDIDDAPPLFAGIAALILWFGAWLIRRLATLLLGPKPN